MGLKYLRSLVVEYAGNTMYLFISAVYEKVCKKYIGVNKRVFSDFMNFLIHLQLENDSIEY